MKKIIALILCLAMALSFIVSCGKNENTAESDGTAENTTTTEAVESTAAEGEKTDNDGINYLVLVNKDTKLPEGFEDTLEGNLENFHVEDDWDVTLEKKCMESILAMKEKLAEDGVYIELDSGYRSVAEQEKIMEDFTEQYGEEYAKTHVAIPGYSEHHTGLAVDVCLVIDGEFVYENEEMMKETELWEKIHALLSDYGFILRYPEGKEDITGYSYEPWHFRYVGVDIAKEITEQGITFEEFVK